MLTKQVRNGFTMIELLVVVLIIGILTAIAVPQYTQMTEKTELARIFKATTEVIQSQERFFSRNDAYPTAFGQLDIDMRNFTGSSGVTACGVSGTGAFTFTGSSWNICSYTSGTQRMVTARNATSAVRINYTFPNRFPTCEAVSTAQAAAAQRLCLSLGGARVGSTNVYDLRY